MTSGVAVGKVRQPDLHLGPLPGRRTSQWAAARRERGGAEGHHFESPLACTTAASPSACAAAMTAVTVSALGDGISIPEALPSS